MLKYFDLSEFDSPDLKGSGSRMQPSTLTMLDKARELADVPFIINSGYRTPEHNKRVGGVANSSHVKGYAVDISCKSSAKRWVVVGALKKAGFNRIGIGKSFIHADNDPFKIPNVIWLY